MSKNNGGAAFPRPVSLYENGSMAYEQDGMTLRQFYKAAALTGILSNPALCKQIEAVSKLQEDDTFIVRMNCKLAGAYADYMIAEDDEAAKP